METDTDGQTSQKGMPPAFPVVYRQPEQCGRRRASPASLAGACAIVAIYAAVSVARVGIQWVVTQRYGASIHHSSSPRMIGAGTCGQNPRRDRFSLLFCFPLFK
jgi:hypothetical protein